MDDLERKIKESKNRIEDSKLNNAGEIYYEVFSKNKEKNSMNMFRGLTIKLATCVMLIFVLVISIIAIGPKNYVTGEKDLVTFTSKRDINRLIENSFKGNSFLGGIFNDKNSIEEVLPPDQPENDLTNKEESNEYETNNQVEGIDEADIVKVNGEYIYYVSTKVPDNSNFIGGNSSNKGKNSLYIFKANDESIEVIKEINFEDKEILKSQDRNEKITEVINYTPIDLFYTDKYIVLNVSTMVYEKNYNIKENKEYINLDNYSSYYIYDIKTFDLVKSIDLSGNISTSRLIDNKLYVITNLSLEKDKEIYPKYRIDEVCYEAEYNDIYYCPSVEYVKRYINIYKITLDDEIIIDKTYYLSDYVSVIYVSKNAIYLIQNNNKIIEKESNKDYEYDSSKIMIFNIIDKVLYDEYIEVKGWVNDRYWIDEFDGYLRIATTGSKYLYRPNNSGGFTEEWLSSFTVFNYLSIYKEDNNGSYELISQITEGLGEPGEKIKSVRFNENVVTIVTFRQTDPLYYIDLTDPINPVITSELKVSGYSQYQHPYKDNYVIGLGYEADINGIVTGFKVSLYDISDKVNVKEVGSPIVFSYDEYGHGFFNVLSNTKSLFLDLKNNVFGFSLVTYNNKDIYYNSWFILFNIDLNNTNNPISIMYKEINIPNLYYKDINRMVYIGNKYYLLTPQNVYIYTLNEDNTLSYGEIKPLD